jgi:hypothetical protein
LEYKVEGLQGNGTGRLAIAHGRIASPGFYRGHGGFIQTLKTATIDYLYYVNMTFFVQFHS